MLSSARLPTTLVDMKYNMVWDGLFHAFTWLMVALRDLAPVCGRPESGGAVVGSYMIGAMIGGLRSVQPARGPDRSPPAGHSSCAPWTNCCGMWASWL
jgi:hypothetical protein